MIRILASKTAEPEKNFYCRKQQAETKFCIDVEKFQLKYSISMRIGFVGCQLFYKQ